jgi:tetratricopeptide (TPR) repeat protein
MSILTASGERTSALKQYAHCRDLLASELGVEPSWETKHLYQQIAQDSPRRQATDQTTIFQSSASLYAAADSAIAQGHYLLAAEYIEQLMSLAQRCRSTDMIWLAKGLAGVNEFFRGDLQQARLHLDQVAVTDASERSRCLRTITGTDFYATCLHWLSWTLHILCQYQQAKEYAAQAISQAEEHPPSRAKLKVLTYISACCLDRCSGGSGNKVEREGLSRDIAVASTHLWCDLVGVFGEIPGKRARLAGLRADAVTPMTTGGQSLARILHDLVSAELRAQQNAAPDLLVHISQALALVEETGTNVFTAEYHRLRGQALLRLAMQQSVAPQLRLCLERQAEISLCIAVDLAHAQHLPLWELRATTALCGYYQQAGRREALPLLASICARFPTDDPSPDLAGALLLLRSLAAPVAGLA